MPLIWTAITAHGYGHAAQVAPVLNELGKLVPDLKAILRTTVPSSFFDDRLTIPWELQSVEQDVGCVQKGPLEIDVPATWKFHFEFHAEWDQRVAAESEAINACNPQVVLADTPYLALNAGHEAGIPTVGLANLTWGEILEPFSDKDDSAQRKILEAMRQAYGLADHALRIAPGLPMPSFSGITDIGPIAELVQPRRSELRHALGLRGDEQVVLVGFGGVPLDRLPWTEMERMEGYHFIVDGPKPPSSRRIHSRQTLPYSFRSLLASVDVIMTKPGYGTTVEAVALGLPVLYVRRHNFADEPPLVDYVRRYGRGRELSHEEFRTGNWSVALERVRQVHPATSPPPLTGATDAAKYLASFF